MLRIIMAGLLAGIVSLGINSIIAQIALRVTGVPRGFPPFTFLPLLSGCLGGGLLAALVYGLIRATGTPRSDQIFVGIAAVVWLASFALPLRLSYTQSSRFAGVTPAAQVTLGLMHTVVAFTSVLMLTRLLRSPGVS